MAGKKGQQPTVGVTGKQHLSVRQPSDVGALVATVRKGKGYSQEELADLAGVGRRFLSELEWGKPTAEIGKILQVLTALGIDLELRERK